jgi:hypothetical protein
MFVAQGIGQHERVEGIGLGRSEPVAFPGPGGDLRGDAVDRQATLLQVFDQQAFATLDRDLDVGPGGEFGIELGQARHVMADATLNQDLAVGVEDAKLMGGSAPVDPGEHGLG